MALPITIPFTFGNATTTQSLSSLDTNFTTITNSVNGLTNGASQINVASISATGTANASTFLRGDGSWTVVSGTGTVTSVNANSTIGFTFTGGPVTSSGTLTLSGPTPGTSGNVLTSNGTVWVSQAASGAVNSVNGFTGTVQSVLVAGTAVATTSGTSITFTGIPSWAKRITVIFNGVSTTGTNFFLLQVGTGGVPTTSGYSAQTTGLASSSGASSTSTSGYPIYANSGSYAWSGSVTISNVSGNIWVASGVLGNSNVSALLSTTSGTVTLAGVLNVVTLTTVGGTDTFDAGSINIQYE